MLTSKVGTFESMGTPKKLMYHPMYVDFSEILSLEPNFEKEPSLDNTIRRSVDK